MRNQWVTDEHPTRGAKFPAKPERLYNGRDLRILARRRAEGILRVSPFEANPEQRLIAKDELTVALLRDLVAGFQ